MLGGADNSNGELPSYITGADSADRSDFYTGSRPFLYGSSPGMNNTTACTQSVWSRTP